MRFSRKIRQRDGRSLSAESIPQESVFKCQRHDDEIAQGNALGFRGKSDNGTVVSYVVEASPRNLSSSANGPTMS